MKSFIQYWKVHLLLWIASIALFLTASYAGYFKGPDTIQYIAGLFHQNRVHDMLEARNYHAAAKEYIAWSWLKPDDQDLIKELAETHLLDRQPHRAYYIITPLAGAMTPDAFDLCRLMALIQADRKEPSALEWARRAQNSAGPDQQAQGALITAHVHRKAAQTPEAIKAYAHVLDLERDHPEAVYYSEIYREQATESEAFSRIPEGSRKNFAEFACTPEFILKYHQLDSKYAK